jgi:hypothetical protein
LFFLCLGLAVPAGAGNDPQQVLERARTKLQAMTHTLANYACIETVERRYFEPAAATPRVQAAPASCSQVRVDPDSTPAALKLEATDRLRLEVTVSEGREIYSWPGATRFDSRDVDEIIHEGPIGTGSFGTHLLGIFDNPGAEFHFTAERTSGGQTLLEYRFHVPLQASHYRVKVGTAWQPIAYDGSFWIDPDSLQLRRLTVRAEDVPPATSMCQLDAELDYRSVHIGDGDALLPSQGQLRIVLDNARQTNNITTFADCREYQAESALLFEDGAPAKSTVVRPPMKIVAMPLGLPLTLALSAPIDTDTAAAGDLVAAKVVKAVRRPGSNETLIPAGATVRGRITRLERHLLPSPYFLIALSFNRLAIGDFASPFAARSEGNVELARELGATLVGQGRGLAFWDVGTFLFPTNRSRYVVPAGYESKWITLAIRGR